MPPPAPAPDPAALAAAIRDLQALLAERLSLSADERALHGKDESYHRARPADAVAFPRSTDEVAEIVRICARRGVPLIPFGAGTSLEGHVIPVRGGVSLDTRKMNRVLRVSAEDMDVTVEPGVTRLQLERELRGSGLFFPVDPGADATLGGMAATGASGTTTVRYGAMRQNVLSLEVVLADGRVIETAGRARKSSAGYDLTHLFIGSEGTLGVITRLTLRLHPVPEAVAAAVCAFPSLDAAVDTVIATMQASVPVARVEVLDAVTMDAVRRYSGLDYAAAPTLFFEFHGAPAEVREQARAVEALAAENGGGAFAFATAAEDRQRLWKARHDVYPATLALRPGSRGWTTDVCVPLSRLAECIRETRADLERGSLQVGLVGHAGDGNFHLVFLIDPDRPEELAEAEALNGRLVERALAMDGTCTGEHGVGLGKMRYLPLEHGAALAVMATIKRALDPRDILNPGKIVPL